MSTRPFFRRLQSRVSLDATPPALRAAAPEISTAEALPEDSRQREILNQRAARWVLLFLALAEVGLIAVAVGLVARLADSFGAGSR